MPNTGRNLIRAAGGDMEPGEKLKGYFRRVAELTGLGFRSIERAWRGDYVSKNTATALLKAAQEKAKNDDDKIIAAIKTGIAFLEAVDADFHRPHIDAGRQFLAGYREQAETRLSAPLPERHPDDSEGN
jgi:hypothetical protein